MKKFSFKGGIHPDDNKKTTNSKPISSISAPQFMYYPLNQHIGAPLKPLVKIGDAVKMHQKIADSDAYLCAPLHSSVSGYVIDIGMYPHPSGIKTETIVIENDGCDSPAPPLNTKSLDELSSEEIIKIVREAGIVGMGGASFPTHVKLSPPSDKKIDYVIVNGAECEPYITSDHRVMLESPLDVLFGLKAVMKVFSLNKAYIAVEDNKLDAIKLLKENAAKFNGIDIITLKKKYPQGSEKHLIYSVTKRRVPSGKLPLDVGCVVLNIDTIVSITQAIKDGIPLIRRIVTVAGSSINTPSNYSVRLGTPFDEIITASGGMKEDCAKIIMGGPMMGIALESVNFSVLKNTSALLFFNNIEAHLSEESPCIRCAKCVSVCPMNLLPLNLYNYSIRKDTEKCIDFNILDCIECGSCSYVCPAKRHIVQAIRTGKILVKREKEKSNER